MKTSATSKVLVAACGFLALAVSASVARTGPQVQERQPPYTRAEYNAYENAAAEPNPQARLKDLDQFVREYPASALLQYAYVQVYQTYLSLKNYPQTVAYADKDLALGDKLSLSDRLQALYTREIAYAIGCDNSAFQTRESWSKAKDAAIEGLQLLSQFPKPPAMGEQDFATAKNHVSMLFNAAEQIAESRQAGSRVGCLSSADVPGAAWGSLQAAGLQVPSGQFEDTIQELSKDQNSRQ